MVNFISQGIQTGRLTLAEVLAEQEALIEEIAKKYRKDVAPQQSSALEYGDIQVCI